MEFDKYGMLTQCAKSEIKNELIRKSQVLVVSFLKNFCQSELFSIFFFDVVIPVFIVFPNVEP